MICKECGKNKRRADFMRDKRMVAGIINYCKLCINKKKRERYALNMKDPTWAERQKEANRERSREYAAKGLRRSENLSQERIMARRIRAKKYRQAAQHKEAARKITKLAVKAGKLTRLPCEVCGKRVADAHHDNYSKPLEVRWLCKKHHGEVHRRK